MKSVSTNTIITLLIGTVVAALILFLLALEPAHADVDESIVYRCIIGEAAGEGLQGMTAVSKAIRNRGHLKGVYGCKAKFVDNEPKWVWESAKLAWEHSKQTNMTKGATHWESVDFRTPYWANKMIKTAVVGKHIFYK